MSKALADGIILFENFPDFHVWLEPTIFDNKALHKYDCFQSCNLLLY